MRGDSRQDLYAKLWALMGLGLLAAAGALVDYWPADVRLPRTTGVTLRPTLARAHAVPQMTPAFAITSEQGQDARRVSVAAGTSTVAGLERVSRDVSDDLAAPADSPTFDVVPAVATSAPAQQVSLSLPAAVNEPPDTSDTEPLRQFSTGSDAADSSFFSDAMKMASGSLANVGGSIVTAGTKTGQSVAGAFRVAAGAVKKLKFF